MAWKTRQGKGSYYTHSRRTDKRVDAMYGQQLGDRTGLAEEYALKRQERSQRLLFTGLQGPGPGAEVTGAEYSAQCCLGAG